MRRAEGDEIVGVVPAAIGARVQVVEVDKGRVSTPRNHAAPVVPPEHQPAGGRRDGLDRARSFRAHVGHFRARVGVRLGGPRARVGARIDCLRARVGARMDCLRARVGARTIETTDVLCIASRHLDHFRPDVDLLAVSLHRSTLAALAHRQRHLAPSSTARAMSSSAASSSSGSPASRRILASASRTLASTSPDTSKRST